MQTVDSFNYGTLLSYATAVTDNAFTLTDYTGWDIKKNVACLKTVYLVLG